jgi:hypothetical protein
MKPSTPGCYIDSLGYGCCPDAETIGAKQTTFAKKRTYGGKYWSCGG